MAARKCSIDNNQISIITDELKSFISKDNKSLEILLVDFLKNLNNRFKSVKKKTDIIYDSVNKVFSEVFGEDDIPDYVNPLNIDRILNNSEEDIAISEAIDSLEINNSEEIEVIKLSLNLFLRNAYKTNRSILQYVTSIVNRELCDVLFLDSGKSGISVGNLNELRAKYKNVSNNVALNRRIKAYKNELYKRIYDYLKSEGESLTTADGKAVPEVMYNIANGKYTGALEHDAFLIAVVRLAGPDVFRKIEDLFNKGEYDNPLFLAYNALTILDNFDDYIQLVLPKAIKITPNSYGKETTEHKYKISDNISQMSSSFRTSDDIDVSKETDYITRMLILTRPIISWETGEEIDGKFLSFNDWSFIIANIKLLGFNKYSGKKFNDTLLEGIDEERFSDNVLNVLNVFGFDNLKDIINALPSDPITLFPVVFEILCDKRYYNNNSELYNDIFNIDLLNKMMSINEGIFNTDSSLRILLNPESDLNYYGFCIQSAISVNTNKLLQYFLDIDGNIKPRTIINNAIWRISNSLITKINNINNKNTVDWPKEKSRICFADKSDSLNPNSIEFNIPDSNIFVTVNGHGNTSIYTIKNNIRSNISVNLGFGELESSVRKFIDTTFGLNLASNPELERLINEQYGGNALFNLLIAASRTVYCKYLSNDILPFRGNNIIKAIDSLLPINSSHRFKMYQGDVNLVHPLDTVTINRIARAKAMQDGLTTASTVLDSKGNANSNFTFNRLLETYQCLWELLCRLKSCPVSHFSLLNTDNLIHGIYNMKEFYSVESGTKNTTRMNVSELAIANFVHDFVGGLVPLDNNRGNVLASDGKVLFITSVNADKNLVSKMLVDLNNVPVVLNSDVLAKDNNGNNKKLIDYDRQELITLINYEFYNYYNKMIFHVLDTFNKLADTVGGEIGESLRKGLTDNFESFNSMDLGELTPVQYLNNLVREYNSQNINDRIELVDLTHFIALSNGKIAANEVMLKQLDRYGNNRTSNDFWINKEKEIVKLLLNEDFKLNLSDTRQIELLKLRSDYADWVDASGNMVLCKIKINGKTIDISSSYTIERILGKNWENKLDKIIDFELHPLLSKYNLLDHLITQEFLDSTVGSYTNHSGKGTTFLEKENSLQDAQNKRNSSLTSPVSLWILNSLTGISEDYKIAVVTEPLDRQGTVNGLVEDINAVDAATYVNPFTVILENNSMGGSRSGIVKKPYIHGYNPLTGTGFADKTATFGLNNNKIRNSEDAQLMMQKMTDHSWRDINGNIIELDVSKAKVPTYLLNYYEEDGNYYKIINILKKDNVYVKRVLRVDDYGDALIDETTGKEYDVEEIIHDDIHSNYRLWKMFGGDRSMSLKNGILLYSDASIENVVRAMNTILIAIEGRSNIRTQKGYYQPLKHSDINYVCMLGAVKQGAANINPAERLKDNVPFNYLTVKLYNAGILLDKEHELNNDDVANSTQATNSSAYRGFTFDQAHNLYKALGSLSNLRTQKHLETIKNLLLIPDDKTFLNEFRNVMGNVILDSSRRDSNNINNFAQSIAEGLIARARQSAKGYSLYTDANYPLTDNMVYNKVVSAINSYFTLNGIKAKIPGVLAILNPSFEMLKIYDNKKYGRFRKEKSISLDSTLKENGLYRVILNNGVRETRNDIESIRELISTGLVRELIDLTGTLEEAQLKYDENPVFDIRTGSTSISRLKLNRVYKIYSIDPLTNSIIMSKELVGIPEYMNLKRRILNGEISRIVEDVTVGRNLSSFNALFEGIININNEETRTEFLLYDLDSVKAIYELENIRNIKNREEQYNALQDFMKAYPEIEKAFKNYYITSGLTLINNIDYIGRKLNSNPDNLEEIRESLKELYRNNRSTFSKTERNLNKNLSVYEVYNVIKDEIYRQDFDRKFNFVYNFVHKWKLFDFNVLSTNNLSPLNTYNDLISEKNAIESRIRELNTKKLTQNVKQELDILNISLNNWYTKYGYCMDILFGLHNDGKLVDQNRKNITSSVVVHKINRDNFEEADKLYSEWIKYANKIRIDGRFYDIDKKSVKKEAFECIMPRLFADVFGLNETIDLLEIINDKEYFVKKLADKAGTKVDSNNYTLEFKVSSGKHHYVIDKSLLTGSSLTLFKPFVIEDGDDKWRCDYNGKKLYKIDKNATFYHDRFGNEIIATTLTKNDKPYEAGLGFYINNLHYNSIKLSKTLLHNDNLRNNVLELMTGSSKKNTRELGYFYSSAKNGKEVIEYSNHMNSVNSDNFRKRGLAMHSSFLRSLDVIAARTPGQSMQSFMNMKVVEFDDSGTNATYVSSMLNLLQGSDYDIDTVSLFTFDINRNGILLLWSPYSNLQSLDLLKTSEKLPLPTGNLIGIKKGKEYMNIFNNYIDILAISKSQGKVHIDFNNSTEKQIEILSDLLHSVNVIIKPTTNEDYDNFINLFNNLYKQKYESSLDLISEHDTETVDDIYNQLVDLINAHNTYLTTLSNYDRASAYNNYLISNLIDVISDASNLTQSLQPTDYITLPLKDIADNTLIAKKIKSIGVGNVIGKIKNYTQALIGKEDVGITAVGSKIFSGLTFYYNYILKYGTPEQLRLLLRYKNGKKKSGIDYNKMLANVYTSNLSTIKDMDLLQALSNVDNVNDAALIIAAMISLAADNAKDPKLGKLNATTKTIGMYIYGVMQGQSFKSLADLITSETGLLYSKLLSSNVFTNTFGYNGAYEIKDYFTYALDQRFFNKYNTRETLNEIQVADTPLSIFTDFINLEFKNKLINEEEPYKNDKGEELSKDEKISKLNAEPLGRKIYLFASREFNPNERKRIATKDEIKEGKYRIVERKDALGNMIPYIGESISDKIKILENIRNNANFNYSRYHNELFNQLIDFVEEYIININRVNKQDMWDLIHLADGAEESRVLGLEYSVNQRVQSNVLDFINLIDNFELSVYNRKKKMKLDPTKDDIMDLVLFAFDPEYKKQWIDKYEEVKHTENILSAISYSPNYIAYVESLACALRENMESFKFRNTRSLLNEILVKYKLLNKGSILRGIENYINEYIRDNWLLQSERYIKIPIGTKVFADIDQRKEGEDIMTYTNDTQTIKLGTDIGNANFKLFMENVIIPELKELYPNNRFIQGLTPITTNRTISRNPIVVYSLDINMSPRNDIEQNILDSYKTEFRDLNGSDKVYKIKDLKGKVLLEIPISDLFIYYTMIAHNWRLSEVSLLPILLDIVTTNNLINDFLNFETIFDRSGETLRLEDVWKDLRFHIAKFGRINESGQEVVFGRDSSTGRWEPYYMELQTFDEEGFPLDSSTRSRQIHRANKPYDFFSYGKDRGNFKTVNETIDLTNSKGESSKYNIMFSYDLTSIHTDKKGKTVISIKDVFVKGTKLDIKELKFKKENGKFVPITKDLIAEYERLLCKI